MRGGPFARLSASGRTVLPHVPRGPSLQTPYLPVTGRGKKQRSTRGIAPPRCPRERRVSSRGTVPLLTWMWTSAYPMISLRASPLFKGGRVRHVSDRTHAPSMWRKPLVASRPLGQRGVAVGGTDPLERGMDPPTAFLHGPQEAGGPCRTGSRRRTLDFLCLFWVSYCPFGAD